MRASIAKSIVLLAALFAVTLVGGGQAYAAGPDTSAAADAALAPANAATASAAAARRCGNAGKVRRIEVLRGRVACGKARRILRKLYRQTSSGKKSCVDRNCTIQGMKCLREREKDPNQATLSCVKGNREIFGSARYSQPVPKPQPGGTCEFCFP